MDSGLRRNDGVGQREKPDARRSGGRARRRPRERSVGALDETADSIRSAGGVVPERHRADVGVLGRDAHDDDADAPAEAAPVDSLHAENRFASVMVRKTDHRKCVRCWHYRADVGVNPAHPEICGRCVTNVEGPGENRRWF